MAGMKFVVSLTSIANSNKIFTLDSLAGQDPVIRVVITRASSSADWMVAGESYPFSIGETGDLVPCAIVADPGANTVTAQEYFPPGTGFSRSAGWQFAGGDGTNAVSATIVWHDCSRPEGLFTAGRTTYKLLYQSGKVA